MFKVGDVVRGNTVDTSLSTAPQRASTGIITKIDECGVISLCWLFGKVKCKGKEFVGFRKQELELVSEA